MAHVYARAASALRPRGRPGHEPRAARDPRRWGAPTRRQQTPARQEYRPGRRRPCWAAHRPCPIRALATPRPPLGARQ
eukprot:2559540-Alexandrium_andersonii.AAC.1